MGRLIVALLKIAFIGADCSPVSANDHANVKPGQAAGRYLHMRVRPGYHRDHVQGYTELLMSSESFRSDLVAHTNDGGKAGAIAEATIRPTS